MALLNKLFAVLGLVLAGLSALGAVGPDSLYRRQLALGRQAQVAGRSEEALKQFGLAEQLANHYSMYAAMCEVRMEIGEVIYDHGNYDSALVYFRDAEKLAEDHGLNDSRAYALYYVGKYLETKGDF